MRKTQITLKPKQLKNLKNINLQQLLSKGAFNDLDQLKQSILNAEQLESQVISDYQNLIFEEAQELFAVVGGLIRETATHWDQMSSERQEWYLQAAQRRLTEDYIDNTLVLQA